MPAKATETGWGGRRHGKSVDQHKADGTYRSDRHDPSWKPRRNRALELDDPVVHVAERIGLSPRVAALYPELAKRFEVVSPVEHVDRFLATFCRHTRSVPDGPALGSPFGLEPEQREFLEEALEVDEHGHRVYNRAGMVIPRKCGKTTLAAGLGLYLGSPADGEHRPEVILAAGTLKQTGKLFGQATAFVDDKRYGSDELRELFEVLSTEIRCPSIGGVIQRVAGDGDSNHSLDPHVVIADELHTWKTPKQRENWKALTTAQGAREDPFVLVISTEGEGEENELAQLLDRIESDPATEREERRPGLVVYRNREAGMLVFKYAIPATATIADLDDFVAANPASWRTPKRIAKDLRDSFVDEVTKLRLYGNRRAEHADRWISEEVWNLAMRPELELEEGVALMLGADGARTRDCSALAWAGRTDEGVVIRTRIWSTRPDVAAHVHVPGGRLDNDLLVEYARDVLMPEFAVQMLFYDERYFGDQANDLSDDGLTVVEMHQGKAEMLDAWDLFYNALYEGRQPSVFHDGDPHLRTHVRAATGIKTERGWKVSKLRTARTQAGELEHPIDGLAAAVMAHYGVARHEGARPSFSVLT